ncbi:MAG: TraB/GumN family protein [Bacteroidia bacterium]
MKNTTLVLFFVCAHFIYSQENSLLWEIKGNGLAKSSYLYGTYHSQDSRAHQFGDSVLVKLAKADIVVVENIDVDSKKALDMALMKNKKLEDLLNKEDYEFVKENALEKMGSSGMFYNTMKPLFTMVLAGLLNERKEMPYTVDEFIKNEAKLQNKDVFGLETAEEAIHSLDEVSLKEQSKMLVTYFKKYDLSSSYKDTMVTMYQAQNLNGLYSFYLNQKEIPVSFDKSLVEKRNKKFVERLVPYLKKQSVFCAVGALHLPGETGLINALKKQGYEVTPVFSKYTPQLVNIDDKRDWAVYENDSLLIDMSFPDAPSYDIKKNSETITTLNYTLEDSALIQLYYMVSILNLQDSNATKSPSVLYNAIITKLGGAKGWKKIIEKDIVYKKLAAKEAEFNVSSGINGRYKIILNRKNLYLIGVIGSKQNIYSNIAEHFFQEITFVNPSIFMSLNVSDEVSHKPILFDVAIKSITIDTIIKPDTSGYISFTLPQTEEEYIISVSSKNYVTKKINVNTFGAFKTGQVEVSLNGDIDMILKKAGTDYTAFNTPVAKACMINNTSFSWDMEYIKKMKEEISKKTATPVSK